MSALNTEKLLFEEKTLYQPKFEEIKEVLSERLPKNFQDVSVEIVDCPDLSKAPYNLAGSGLSGSATLIEVGGPPYLLPTPDLSKVYDIKEIVQKSLGGKKCDVLAIGAGAGPFIIMNSNCEGIYNLSITKDGTVTNESYVGKVDGPEEKCIQLRVPKTETRFGLLLNLFACEGGPGKVLRVRCKKRIGELNFIESIRIALAEHFGEKCVGLGGAFILKSGKAKQHVMRNFSKTPLHTEEDLNNWLKFYEMPATLTALGTLITHENDLDLSLQHFHSFSNSNWAGHYHYDTTPDIAEYEGYFNIGEKVVRVDKPVNTHKVGRD